MISLLIIGAAILLIVAATCIYVINHPETRLKMRALEARALRAEGMQAEADIQLSKLMLDHVTVMKTNENLIVRATNVIKDSKDLLTSYQKLMDLVTRQQKEIAVLQETIGKIGVSPVSKGN